MTSSRARTVLAGPLLAVLVLVLGACSGGDGDAPSSSPEQRLGAAKKHLDDTSGLHIALSTPKLPAGVSGLLRAQGVGTHDPAFDGSIRCRWAA